MLHSQTAGAWGCMGTPSPENKEPGRLASAEQWALEMRFVSTKWEPIQNCLELGVGPRMQGGALGHLLFMLVREMFPGVTGPCDPPREFNAHFLD